MLGSYIGLVAFYVPTKEKRIALLQVQSSFPALHAPTIVRSMFSHLGRTMLECLDLAPLLKNVDKYVDCQGWEIVEKLQSEGSNFIVLSAHTGNWDLTAAYGASKGLKLCPVGRIARMSKLHKVLDQIRSSYGVETLWRDQNSSGKEVVKAIRSEKIVCALIDQDTNVSSEHSPFFKRLAKTPSGLVVLAQRLNVKIVVAFNFRTAHNKYKIFIHELPDNLAVSEVLACFNQHLEDYLRRYPEQWVWLHKRWRSTPEGNRLSSSEYIGYLQEAMKSCT